MESLAGFFLYLVRIPLVLGMDSFRTYYGFLQNLLWIPAVLSKNDCGT